MNAITRIHQYFEVQGIKPTRFEKDFGFSNGYFGTQKRRNANLGEDILNKIIDNCLQINPIWLLTGQGEMLKSEKPVPLECEEGGIPLVDVNIAAGFGSADFSIDKSNIIARYKIPDFEKKADLMTYVRGDSMTPSYKSGDIIICKTLTDKSFIQWNEIHIISTQEQGLLLKRIRQSENQECLTCISDNKDYPPFDVPKDQIMGIALVLGSIRFE